MKLTENPAFIDTEDTRKLAEVGWSEKAIWEITALVSFFNFSGRMEAASGLPHDEIPQGARMAEVAHA